MKAVLALPLLLCFAALPTCAQQKCSQEEISRAASAANDLHGQLRALPTDKDGLDEDLTANAQSLIPRFKNSLALVAGAVISCHSTSDAPSVIESGIAHLLRANPPQPPAGTSVSDGDPRYAEWFSVKYGSSLLVHVTKPAAALLAIEFSFRVGCGDDTVLLIFRAEDQHWLPQLVWQAPPYEEITGAFGDFFKFAVLNPDSKNLEVAAAHGHPWCTSRFSGLNIDLLASSPDPNRPRVVWHTERSYSRGDFEESMHGSGDTFELRVHDDEMEFDPDNAFERLVVYRYLVAGDKVTRIEPIAANARGFVEEWLSMPWEEALAQSDSGQAARLKAVHEEYEVSNKDGNAYTSWHSGPVQACTTKDHFQVTVSTERERIVPGKPGGESTPGQTYYFQLQQESGYRLLSIDTAPNATCKGPDLMRKP